jgi:hypothetical protein
MASYRFQRCTVGMEVQSVIFPRDLFSPTKAKSWLRAHGFRSFKMDETDNYFRFRQRPPENFKPGSFRIITLGNSGVRAIVACPKYGRESDKSKRDYREVQAAIKDFRNVPRTGRGKERAARIRRAIGR